MNAKFLGIGLGLLFSSTCALAEASRPYSHQQIIVEYRAKLNDSHLRSRSAMNELYEANGIEEVRRMTGHFKHWEILTLKKGRSLRSALARIKRYGAVRTAGPSVELQGFETESLASDPLLSENWGFSKIRTSEAWRLAERARPVVVGVIDSGIDYEHLDLKEGLWKNPNPGPKGDIVGYDFVNDDGLPMDDVTYPFTGRLGHGTHVSGIIAATRNNGLGVAGIAPNAEIMSLKFLNQDNKGYSANAILGIQYALERGARVLNASWGHRGRTTPGDDMLERAIELAGEQGVVFVAAAGNFGGNNDSESSAVFPASFKLKNIISVANSDWNDQLSSSSNRGASSVHLSAPGYEILSTIPEDRFRKMSGTSMATPFVTGVVALLMGLRPEWSAERVKEAILQSVDPIEGGSRLLISRGRLNAERAVSLAVRTRSRPRPTRR